MGKQIAQQFSLFTSDEIDPLLNRTVKGKVAKKRVRYKKPTYTKKYELIRFNEFTEEWGQDSDEKHIYRYKTLYKIYAKLYEYAELNPFLAKKEIIKRLETQTNLSDDEATIMCRIKELYTLGYAIYLDEYIDDKGKLVIDNQLEIKGTEMLSIKERLKAHISLLRRLKRGERL